MSDEIEATRAVVLLASGEEAPPCEGVFSSFGRALFSGETDRAGDGDVLEIEVPSGGLFRRFWLGPGEIARTASPRIFFGRGVAEGVSDGKGVSSGEALSSGVGVALGVGVGVDFGEDFGEAFGEGDEAEAFR